jgi:hypothetical protein
VCRKISNDEVAQSSIPPAPGVQKGSMASAIPLAAIGNVRSEKAEVVVIALVRSKDMHKCGFSSNSDRKNFTLNLNPAYEPRLHDRQTHC